MVTSLYVVHLEAEKETRKENSPEKNIRRRLSKKKSFA